MFDRYFDTLRAAGHKIDAGHPELLTRKEKVAVWFATRGLGILAVVTITICVLGPIL